VFTCAGNYLFEGKETDNKDPELLLWTATFSSAQKKLILTCQTLFQENNALHRGHESGESEGSRHINRAQQNSLGSRSSSTTTTTTKKNQHLFPQNQCTLLM
jgi:hypothetical protein